MLLVSDLKGKAVICYDVMPSGYHEDEMRAICNWLSNEPLTKDRAGDPSSWMVSHVHLLSQLTVEPENIVDCGMYMLYALLAKVRRLHASKRTRAMTCVEAKRGPHESRR